MDATNDIETPDHPGKIFVPRFAVSIFIGLFGFIVIGLVAVMVQLSANRSAHDPVPRRSQGSPISLSAATQTTLPGTLTSDQIIALCGGGDGSAPGWALDHSELGDNPQVWSNVIVNDAVTVSSGGENNNQANAQVGDNSPNATSQVGSTIDQRTNGIAPTTTAVN